jgi:hypothetical protein
VIDVRIIGSRRLGAFRLSVLSTFLVFVVIPVGFIAVVATLVLSGGDKSRPSRRYRPGRPYDFQPTWFLASPERVRPAIGPAGDHARQRAVEAPTFEDAAGERVLPGPTGGASDRW